jgi:hypothetical protein
VKGQREAGQAAATARRGGWSEIHADPVPTNLEGGRTRVTPYGGPTSEGAGMTAQMFFGYASKPELSRETLYSASTEVASTGLVEATSWESLKVGGRVVMTAIFQAIDDSQLAAFDVSTLNENVLFEVGYAIGRAKGIWLLLDTTDGEAKWRWKQFRLLSSVGYVGWVNAEDIKVAFLRDQPHQSESTIFDDLIEPNLTPPIGASIFYFPSFHDTDASKELGRRLDAEVKRGIRLLSADPTESAIN